jgi:hypothetical protein
MRRLSAHFDPVESDTYAYLDREDQEPETERARCTCGRFFRREIPTDNYRMSERLCPLCKRASHYKALVARSPLLQRMEGARNTYIAVGSLAPVRRTA